MTFMGSMGSIQSFQKTDDGIVLNIGDTRLILQVWSENKIRLVYSPEKKISKRKSLIVNRIPEKTDWSYENKPDRLIIQTSKIKAEIDSNTGSVIFFDASGNILLRENPEKPHNMVPAVVMEEKTWHAEQKFILTEDEGLFGLGQLVGGDLNHRGKDITLVQHNMEAVNPFLVSSKCYGILWDNYSKTIFHDGEDGMSFWSEVADQIDFYFISGETLDEVIKGYRYLTGDAPMFGKWAFGYWQSKERYIDADDLVNTISEYRKRKIPIDTIVQDWRYWGENDHWSSMEFDKSVYPDPAKTIKELHEKYRVHYMISIWPALGIKTDIYEEMKKNGFLFKPMHWSTGFLYDAYSEEARKIYWKYLNKGLVSKGVDALWMDGTEPELLGAHEVLSSEKFIKRLGKNALGTMARYLNTFSLMTTKGAFEGLRKAAPDKRAIILTRSGFAGQQRNAAVTWSGDVSANWNVFRKQISAGVNFCMSGIPYWSHDIGAFFTSGRDYGYGPGLFPGGCNDPAYREFYVRWFQFGAFTPIFRAHGTQTPREIWRFGEKGSWAYEALMKFNNLRYRLMPYIYSLAWKVTNDGYTIMRGLPMDFTEDVNTFNINNQYMFGPAFLVCPVTEEMFHKTKKPGFIIQSEFLRTPDENEKGLKGEYFKDVDLKEKVKIKTDNEIDFNWSSEQPEECPGKNYSVRWTGKLLAKKGGKYEIGVISSDSVKLWLDNKLIIDKSVNQSGAYFYADMNFKPDSKHKIKVEYVQGADDAVIKLVWKMPPDINKENNERNKWVEVYLPESTGWYDFWTGDFHAGGHFIKKVTPVDILPLYVKAGSIIPMGPFRQYSDEIPENPVELRVYTGEDAEFNIYEDENDNYNYENGIYTVIPVKWNDREKILTFGERQGKFPGMLEKRIFNVVIVRKGSGTGVEISRKYDKTVEYDGNKTDIHFSNHLLKK
ncbi:TIM-barrel domain-containing protein [candidate division KSB1 bacterium]